MAKGINTNSKEWCDIVFEGKNKKYGAYRLRLNSSRRHIVSFLLALSILGLIAMVPALIERIEFYIFQKSAADYVLEDYKYITESLTEIEMQQLTKQFVPNAVEEKKSSYKTEARLRKLINKERLLTIIVDDNQVNDNYVQDLIESDSSLQKELEPTEEKTESEVDDGLYLTMDEMPSFPGGEPGLMEYVYKNLRYPPQAMREKIESCVICSFIIDIHGNVTNPEIMQPAHPLLNAEALRIVRALPRWKPAKNHGKPIRVKYSLPIIFRLK